MTLFKACRDANGAITDFRFLLTNPANAQTAQRTVEEMTGKSLLTIFPDAQPLMDMLENVMETGVSQSYRHLHKGDGIEVWMDTTLVRVEEEDSVLMTYLDVTELVQQAEALAEARQKAERALKVRDEFLANISHEIRTPLNSILGFAELLGEELTCPEQLAYATSIRGAGHTLLKLINNVLDLAKLDADQLEIEKQPTSLKEVLGTMAGIIKARAHQKGLTFTFLVDDQIPPTVLADSLRLTQILMNLCENAIKFTGQGGIELAARLVSKPTGTATIAFRVTDTGIGIPAAKLPLIFDRYQQTSLEVTRRYGGTGLGLSIVRSLVQRMGGTINVTSDVTKGSSFVAEIQFDLPVTAPVVSALPTAPEVTQFNRPITVLLVEDNPYNQRVVESLLKRFPVTLIKANNGLEGLYQLRRQTVDVVLMDIQMPFMDGYTTTYHIRQTMGLSVPIVAVTANALTNEREICLSKGMDDYLAKPFTRHELTTILIRHTTQTDDQLPNKRRATLSQLSPGVLSHLHGDDLNRLRSQYEAFEKDWPRQCQSLCESLSTNQLALFQQLVPPFYASLKALGINKAAQQLDQLNQQFDVWQPEERSQQINQFVDSVEEAIIELKQLTEEKACSL